MVRYSFTDRRLLLKGLLVVGFGCVLYAILRARGAPATTYEVSLYRATPLGTWIGLVTAATIGVLGLAIARSRWVFRGSLALLGLAVAVVVALPLVRGYHYFGRNDPLTHLGLARQMAAGDLSPLDLIYPAAHEVSVVLGGSTGLALSRTMPIVVVVTALLFVVFVALSVRHLVGDRSALALATVSALLLLPINLIGFHLTFFPFALAAFYATILVYLLVRYLAQAGNGWQAVRTRDSGLLVVILAVIVLAHPQTMADVVLLLAAIAAVQFAVGYARPRSHSARFPPISFHVVVAVVLFLAWAARFPDLGRFIGQFVASLAAFALGGTADQTIQQQGASLAEIGVPIWVVGLKLFAVTALYLVLSGWLVVRTVLGERRDLPGLVTGTAVFLAAGILPLAGFGLLHFFGPLGTSTFAFRHLGFVMILGTVLGSIALWRLCTSAGIDLPTRPAVGSALAVVAVVLLVASLLTVFPSPYIYKPNQHVTEAEMTGHAAAFERQAPGTQMTGVRDAPFRYADALAISPRPTLTTEVPEAVLASNLTSHYERPTYVAVTAGDYGREVEAYREVRYAAGAIDRLERTPGVNLVQSNGEFRLYYVP